MTKAQLREMQLQAALTAVIERPGSTAYGIGLHVPVPLEREIAGFGMSAPMTLVLSLLRDLEKEGKVSTEPDPKGDRWYPAEIPQKGQEAPDDDDDPPHRHRPEGSS